MLIISEVSASLIVLRKTAWLVVSLQLLLVYYQNGVVNMLGFFLLDTFLQALQLPPRKTGSAAVPVWWSLAALDFDSYCDFMPESQQMGCLAQIRKKPIPNQQQQMLHFQFSLLGSFRMIFLLCPFLKLLELLLLLRDSVLSGAFHTYDFSGVFCIQQNNYLIALIVNDDLGALGWWFFGTREVALRSLWRGVFTIS